MKLQQTKAACPVTLVVVGLALVYFKKCLEQESGGVEHRTTASLLGIGRFSILLLGYGGDLEAFFRGHLSDV